MLKSPNVYKYISRLIKLYANARFAKYPVMYHLRFLIMMIVINKCNITRYVILHCNDKGTLGIHRIVLLECIKEENTFLRIIFLVYKLWSTPNR